MITLLLAFFMMLYSMSILDLNRFKQVAGSIRSEFRGAKVGKAHPVAGKDGAIRINSDPGKQKNPPTEWPLEGKLKKIISKNDLGKTVKIRQDERGIVVSLVTDKVVFTRGQADMSLGTRKIISFIAGPLKNIKNKIMVEGHTCDLPIQSVKYPSNWELSTARAASVIRYLIEDVGIESSRLSAAGYADSKPLVPNTSEANRAQNRRVDIIILKGSQEPDEVKH
jgi:chemotaxis protein MotB